MNQSLLINFSKVIILICSLGGSTLTYGFNSFDSIPYEGFRIHLTNIQLLRQKNDRIKISYNIVNTGRRDLSSSSAQPLPKSLVVDFEDALKSCECKLASYQDVIQQKVRDKVIKLSAGQSIRDNVLEISLNSTELAKGPNKKAAKFKGDVKETAIVKEQKTQEKSPVVQKESEQLVARSKPKKEKKPKKAKTNKLAKSQKKTEENAIEEVAPAIAESPNRETTVEDSAIDHSPIDESIAFTKAKAIKKSITNRSASPPEIQAIAISSYPDKNIDPKEETIDTAFTIENQDEVPAENSSGFSFAAKQCSDIIVDSIKIVKLTKNWVTIEYTLTNLGNYPAKLVSDNKTLEQAFAIKAFLSSTEKLTRGALPLTGTFIKSIPNNEEGLLNTNESYIGTLKINIQKKTRFTPNLIISLDPYLALEECNRSNNNGVVALEPEIEEE